MMKIISNWTINYITQCSLVVKVIYSKLLISYDETSQRRSKVKSKAFKKKVDGIALCFSRNITKKITVLTSVGLHIKMYNEIRSVTRPWISDNKHLRIHFWTLRIYIYIYKQ
ncbi:uncharacterized protein LOC112688996 isoform X2 [Sipha flava]|uniref:Uncharacterized protein LOC112688996 isoform X2 n=1 Tax=Sipha flava TaxID=143950 RepID=A0A8B8G4U4_9HEMI|nr:uncharacterized protein LOC112688996 isoform X2 [Sipha flava]